MDTLRNLNLIYDGNFHQLSWIVWGTIPPAASGPITGTKYLCVENPNLKNEIHRHICFPKFLVYSTISRLLLLWVLLMCILFLTAQI